MSRATRRTLALAILALAFPACGDDPLDPATGNRVPARFGDPVKLGIGQSASYDDGLLEVAFDDLLEDSRCPVEQYCIDPGLVRVGLVGSFGTTPAVPFELIWPSGPMVYDYAGFRIEYLGLSPPRSLLHPSRRKDYRLEIVVTVP